MSLLPINAGDGAQIEKSIVAPSSFGGMLRPPLPRSTGPQVIRPRLRQTFAIPCELPGQYRARTDVPTRAPLAAVYAGGFEGAPRFLWRCVHNADGIVATLKQHGEQISRLQETNAYILKQLHELDLLVRDAVAAHCLLTVSNQQ